MSTNNKKISFLGLALSLTLVATGCGRGFEANKGVAGKALTKTSTGDAPAGQSPEELAKKYADQAQAREQSEKELKAADKDGSLVAINEQADSFITGASLARIGEGANQQVVFTAIVKEKATDNKASLEITAKIAAAADGVNTTIEASKITIQTLKGSKTEVEPKAEEYSLISKCQDDCSEIKIRMQRKGDSAAYAADFTFALAEDQKEGTNLGSSLAVKDKFISAIEALKQTNVDTEQAGSETTGDAAAKPEAAPAAGEVKAEDKPADTAAQADEAKTEETKPDTGTPDAAADAAAKTEEKPAPTEDPAAKATVDAAVAAETESAKDAKAADEASKTAQMTVDESGAKADEAGRLAQKAAKPTTKPSKSRLQITRDITVKKAQIVRLNSETQAAKNAMNKQRATMWKASSDLKAARLEYEKLDKGMSNFFGTNGAAKTTARVKIDDKTRYLKVQLSDMKLKLKALAEKVKSTKTALGELETLKNSLKATK